MLSEKLLTLMVQEILQKADGGILLATSDLEFETSVILSFINSKDILEQNINSCSIIGVTVNVVKNSPEILKKFVKKVSQNTAVPWKIVHIKQSAVDDYKSYVRERLRSNIALSMDKENVVGIIATNGNVTSDELNQAYRYWKQLGGGMKVFLYDFIPFLAAEKSYLENYNNRESFIEVQINQFDSFGYTFSVCRLDDLY